MNFEIFIVKRIISSQSGGKSGAKALVNISVAAIALSLSVMIIAVTVLTGFKREIKEKLTGFGSHIQISNLDTNNSYETEPILRSDELVGKVSLLKQVGGIHAFATKPGIVKSGKELQGIVLKGVEDQASLGFYASSLVAGELPRLEQPDSLDVLVSQSLANLLRLEPGMKLPTYFVQEPLRMRPFVIRGIYNTGLEEYDKLFVICHLSHIQEINNWSAGQVSGYEIRVRKPLQVDQTAKLVQEIADRITIQTESLVQVRTIRELAPGFFDFLSLTDTNVWVILTLMTLIAGFNMISGLLIIILDRVRMIGTLKALGTANRSMVRIFLYQAAFITGKGLLIGNVIGISLALLQMHLKIIPLDPESYFVNAVPVFIKPLHIILINLGTMLLTILMLLVPAGVISRISPDKTLKFD
ncbi:MAG: FtsX-like permease family protein [Bacteroidales bacterium]